MARVLDSEYVSYLPSGADEELEEIIKELKEVINPHLTIPGNEQEIVTLEVWIEEQLETPIEKVCFTQSLEEYHQNYEILYQALAQLDDRLEKSRYLFGDYITTADLKLYTTLVRLDTLYARYIGQNKQRLLDYENLWPYARDIYQYPAVYHHTSPVTIHYEKAHVRNKWFSSVLPHTDLDAWYREPTKRAWLSKDPYNKFYLTEDRAKVYPS